MCGRTACTLCKKDIQHATRQYSEKNELPKWIEKYPWQNYVPVYNLAPTHVIPVLVKERLLNADERGEGLMVFPMRWGMVPYWFKGSFISDFPNSNHNCRSETILKRPTFRGPMLTGKRCVILSDGYYEWKDGGKAGKVPYFIHFPNEHGVQMHERTFQDENFYTEDGKWMGPRLLTMAGIFDIWKSPEAGTICSCSVLTVDSSKTVSSIHDRMPAILDGVDAVRSWLNSKEVSYEEAISNLKPVEKLKFYEVKTVVNNVRNNTVECIKPVIPGRSVAKGCGFAESEQPGQMNLEYMFERMKNKRMKLECDGGEGRCQAKGERAE